MSWQADVAGHPRPRDRRRLRVVRALAAVGADRRRGGGARRPRGRRARRPRADPQRRRDDRRRAAGRLRARRRSRLRGRRDLRRWSRTSGSGRARGPRGRWRDGASSGSAVPCWHGSAVVASGAGSWRSGRPSAGLAYGALLDLSVMVSYGGEQSLDRYLALSARGIPFNVLHAAGNFTLMLAAGPAMVRMLDRYRDRFDFAWRDRPIGRIAALPRRRAVRLPPRCSRPPEARRGPGARSAKQWLVGAQNKNGGYGTEPRPGVERRDDRLGDARDGGGRGQPARRSPGRQHAGRLPAPERRLPISSTGDLERTILALVGAGVDPRSFAGRDLVGELRDRKNRDGSYQQQVNLTAYAVLAQRAAKVDKSKLGKSAKWLRKIQNKNGGWGSVAGAEQRAGQHRRGDAGARRRARRQEPDQGGGEVAALGPARNRRLVAGRRRLLEHRSRPHGRSRASSPPARTRARSVPRARIPTST